MPKQDITQQNNSSKIEEMAQKGLAFGHKTAALHPNMEPYVLGKRGQIHIIDLSKTQEKIQEAQDKLEKLAKNKKSILVVGTKVHLQKLVTDFVEELDLFYVNQRWIGGTLTNFKVISERVKHLQNLEKRKAQGKLKKYTKKEQLEFDREIERLERKFGGLKDMKELPEAIIVLDMDKNKLAVDEAQKKDITTIALADTNINPENIDYPVPVNDDAISAVSYILERFKEAIKKGRQQQKKTSKKKSKKKSKKTSKKKSKKKSKEKPKKKTSAKKSSSKKTKKNKK